MVDREKIKSQIIELAQLQLEFEAKVGTTMKSDLFEEILDKEDEIIKAFGLRRNLVNVSQLAFAEVPNDTQLNGVINVFERLAKEYLLSQPIPDLKLLKDAFEKDWDYDIVFSELNILPHTYTIYVFNVILKKQKDTIENVLEELKYVSEESDLLDTIGRLAQATPQLDIYSSSLGYSNYGPEEVEVKIDGQKVYMPPSEIEEYLVNKGVKYINRYIISLSNLLDDDDY